MSNLNEFFSTAPFSLIREEKQEMLDRRLTELTSIHYGRCAPYRRILDAMRVDPEVIKSYRDMPFLPVALFKELDLMSIDESEIAKTMTSSGTTGQAASKVYLDKETASNQQKTLVKIVGDFTGASRMPMLIIDSPTVLKDRNSFSARGAGILGFSIFGSDRIYALNENIELDIPAVEAFLEKHKGKRILVFGFTYMVWLHFYSELVKLKKRVDLQAGILIHGGGWKRLIGEAVSKADFKEQLKSACGLTDVHDYYGMVEQTGCIYMECGYGYLHASIYSDVITRRHIDFSPCGFGEPGIVQVVSVLPESYPGHSLLTEDEGVIIGEDDCLCGRKGKYFHINGRLKQAELRGCSDV